MARSHVIIYNQQKKYLIMKKYKIKKGLYDQLLSGKVEKNESYIETIIREIYEEINLKIDVQRIRKLIQIDDRCLFYLELSDNEMDNIQLSNEHIGYSFIKDIRYIPELIKKQAKGYVSNIVEKIIRLNTNQNNLE